MGKRFLEAPIDAKSNYCRPVQKLVSYMYIHIVVISSDKILKFTLILFIIKVYIVACKIIIIAVQFTLLIINEKRQCDEIDKLLK